MLNAHPFIADSLAIRLSGDYAHDGRNGPGSTIVSLINPITRRIVVDPIPRDIGLADPRTVAVRAGQYNIAAGRFGAGPEGSPFLDNDFWGVKGQVDADLGFATLALLAAYRGSNIHSLEFSSGIVTTTKQKDDQVSVELRLTSLEEGFLRWLGGLYYFDENVSTRYQFNLQTLATFQTLDTGTPPRPRSRASRGCRPTGSASSAASAIRRRPRALRVCPRSSSRCATARPFRRGPIAVLRRSFPTFSARRI